MNESESLLPRFKRRRQRRDDGKESRKTDTHIFIFIRLALYYSTQFIALLAGGSSPVKPSFSLLLFGTRCSNVVPLQQRRRLLESLLSRQLLQRSTPAFSVLRWSSAGLSLRPVVPPPHTTAPSSRHLSASSRSRSRSQRVQEILHVSFAEFELQFETGHHQLDVVCAPTFAENEHRRRELFGGASKKREFFPSPFCFGTIGWKWGMCGGGRPRMRALGEGGGGGSWKKRRARRGIGIASR